MPDVKKLMIDASDKMIQPQHSSTNISRSNWLAENNYYEIICDGINKIY